MIYATACGTKSILISCRFEYFDCARARSMTHVMGKIFLIKYLTKDFNFNFNFIKVEFYNLNQ